MPCLNPMDCRPGDPSQCLTDDVQVQVAVLSILLAEHPVQLTISELARQFVDDPDDFGERDAVRRAVRDLAGIGLLHRQGNFVLPSRVALDYERLEEVA
jgi:hypothetical protein